MSDVPDAAVEAALAPFPFDDGDEDRLTFWNTMHDALAAAHAAGEIKWAGELTG